MPQYFLSQAGVQVTDFTGTAGFSGSHDTTAKLVEAGTYQAGALNSAVWDDRVKTGKIDTLPSTVGVGDAGRCRCERTRVSWRCQV